ncbi:GTP-binding protein YPTC1 [Drosophila elegans]|uniref:GTP-binding protein YPTC1 n=1 Tax=Drosophila elegans TaxID=30023 RepID=UPI0007E7BC5F|nr:GTP-binding protein YPTC1 [Drosophila elegans]
MMSDSDYRFKILILGDSAVGKSCLLMRFADGCFTGKHEATVGVDFRVRRVEVAGKVVRLQIWDTAGGERYRAVLPAYYRGAHGVLLVYDTTSASSFRSIDSWLDEIRRRCSDRITIMLVGNKCDDLKRRQVSQCRATYYAAHRQLAFCEASAKSGTNVSLLFFDLAASIFNRLVVMAPPTKRLQAGHDGNDELGEGHPGQSRTFRLDNKGQLGCTGVGSCFC